MHRLLKTHTEEEIILKSQEQYVVLSLELHLFFARIMKEHALFLEAAATPVDSAVAKEADSFKQEFEKVLSRAVTLGDGVVGRRVLSFGELITEFTSRAEKQTQRFTGISINRNITAREARLQCGRASCANTELHCQVSQLNQTALRLLNGLIGLKERILNNVLNCRMFTMNYPLLLEHIIREAKLYCTFLQNLESGSNFDCQSMRETERFWNQIMMEHAMFIRGLLDPSENELIESADDFAKDYAELLAKARAANDKTLGCRESLQETLKFREFKAAGAKGIQNCQIRSVILPLLADHVLREANHYVRLLSDS